MTQKEAVVIILDVGPSVVRCPSLMSDVDTTTFLDKSLKCMAMILQRKLFAESKDEVALILSGTMDTDNPLASASASGEYRNISVAQELNVVSWAFMEMVQRIKPGGVTADIVDALVVAMDHLNWTTITRPKCKFTGRQIYLMSDFGGHFSTDQIDVIVSGLQNSSIELNVIGPDLHPSSGFDDLKIKPERLTSGEEVIRRILQKTNGESFSFSQVVPLLSFFKPRTVRPTPWKVPLEIGPKLSIPVCCYIKVKRQHTRPWKKSCGHDMSSRIIVEQSYHRNDDLQVAIDKADTIEAHRYGRTLVPFSEEDKANMEYNAGGKSFAILGFTKQKNILRQNLIGDSVHIVIADPAYEPGITALSAFINALHELHMVGIVRHVYSQRSSVKIGVLIPRIKAKYECFVFIQLAFAEDLRSYVFKSLDANPKNKPTAEQLSVVDELIDAMDLSRPKERFKPTMTFNPYVQRLYQCLLHRGLNPGAPLPEIDPELLRTISPDPQMLEACEPIGKKLQKLFPLKKVESAKDKKTALNIFKDTGELKDENEPTAKVTKMEVDDFVGVRDFVKVGVTEVGTVSPADDFLEIVRNNRGDLDNACQQIMRVIVQLVMDSFGELQCQENYKKALASLDILRRESIVSTATSAFNEFLRDFKVSLLAKGKHVFWEQIRTGGKGLIASDESPNSDVTKDVAQAFLIAMDDQVKVDTQPEVHDRDEDVDDLLDMM